MHPGKSRSRQTRYRAAISAAGVLAAACLAVPAAGAASSNATHTKTFSTPGTYSFKVPKNVTKLTVTAVGGAGGACTDPEEPEINAIGGEGASVAATVSVKPGTTLDVGVAGVGGPCGIGFSGPVAGGAGGSGGGGTGGPAGTSGGSGAGGGGASGIGLHSLAADGSPLVVAAGGGGATFCGGNGGNAGSAGVAGPICGSPPGGGGGAGSSTGGGSGGTPGDGVATAGSAGSAGTGGTGGTGDPSSSFAQVSGGGGGGGYYGGGGGGGGGGSSFIAHGAKNVTPASPTNAAASVTITYKAAPKPKATTHAASGVTSASATLHGSVNPEGLKTKYYFQYGTTKSYGHKSAKHSLSAGTKAKKAAASISGLKPGTTYYFRVVAVNASGTARGKTRTFRTGT